MNYDGESEKLPEVHYFPPELDEDELQSEEKESDKSERAPSYIEATNPIATEGSNHWSVSPTRCVSSTQCVFSTWCVSSTRAAPLAQSDNAQWSTPSPQSLKELIKNILID